MLPFGAPALGNAGFAVGILASPLVSFGVVVLAVDAVAQGVSVPGPCLLFVDPGTVFAVLETAPNGVLGLPIPANPASLGLRFAVQGAFLDASGALCATNALELTIGT